MDVKNIRFGVIDYDHSRLFHELLGQMEASSYFVKKGEFSSLKECEKYIFEGKLDACLIIPRGCYEKLLSNRTASILLVVDGSDPNLATTVVNYFHAFFTNSTINKCPIKLVLDYPL